MAGTPPVSSAPPGTPSKARSTSPRSWTSAGPTATQCAYGGEALRERGIHPGDILIADAAAAPATGKVCVAFVHGEVLVATLAFRRGGWWLYPASEARGEPVAVADEAAEVWAVVCGLVRTDV